MASFVKDFSDIQDAVLSELKIQSSDAVSKDRVKRWINIIYQEVVSKKKWDWLRGVTRVQLRPFGQWGTASLTTDSVTVTLSTSIPLSEGSKVGHKFAVNGYSEVYTVVTHTPGSAVLILDAPYSGTTQAAQSYKIWNDTLPLPTDCREVVQAWHDFQRDPLQNMGLQEIRRYIQSYSPRAESRPQYFSVSDFKDPDVYSALSNLPACVSRASTGTIRTVTFASTVASIFTIGERIVVQNAGNYHYNGEAIVANVATNVLTYIHHLPFNEATAADTALIAKTVDSQEDGERYRALIVYPSLSNKLTNINVDYIKDASPLVLDGDEPIIPIEYRPVLVYGALSTAWRALNRNPEEAATNERRYMQILSNMEGKQDVANDKPKLSPGKDYLNAKRANRKGRMSSGIGMGADGSGGNSFVSFLQNVTIDGATIIKDVAVSPGVLIDGIDISASLGAVNAHVASSSGVHGVTGSVVGDSDAQTLLNKVIQVANNTVVGTASRAAEFNGSGNLSPSTVTTTELGFVSGVTSAIQTQINTKQATGNYITALTSDVSASGPGSATATIVNNAVTNAKAAQMPANTIKGNNTGGLANAADLTVAQTQSMLSVPTSSSPLPLNAGGTGTSAASANAAFNALSPMSASGDIIYGGASGAATRLPKGTDGTILTLASGVPSWASSSVAPTTNVLVNSGFDIWQRGSSTTVANAASTYLADQWYVKNSLGTNGVITYSRTSGAISGSKYGASVQITTAPTALQTNGTELYQVLDNLSTLPLYNQTASFGINIKALGNVTQVGLQFFYATSEVKLTTSIGSETLVTVSSGAFTLGSIAGQALGTSMTVAGVVGVRIRITGVSSGNAYDVNNGFVVEQAMLNIGAAAAAFKRTGTSFGAEVALCKRFFEKDYSLDTAPGTTSAGTTFAIYAPDTAGSNIHLYWMFSADKRAVPTITFYNDATGAAGTWRDSGGADASVILYGTPTTAGASFTMSGSVVATRIFVGHATADASI